MNEFEGIIEFVTVAETNGFSAAAKRLQCSTSHISRQINKLEKKLSCTLFIRNTRNVKLTIEGQAYYQQCKQLVSAIKQANEEISSKNYNLKGTLRVSVAGNFAEKYIAPALLEFAKNRDELNLEIEFNSKLINLAEDNFDFAIRYGRLSDSSLIARKLVTRKVVAVASPSFLQKYGTPEIPEDLLDYPCIITNNDHWYFQRQEKVFTVRIPKRLKSNNANVVVDACVKGFGIAYLPQSSLGIHFKNGDLVPILEDYWSKEINSWIVYQKKSFLPIRTRLAIDFLVEYFQDWEE